MQNYEDLYPEKEVETVLSLLNDKDEIEEFKLIDSFFIDEKEYFIIAPLSTEDNEVWLMHKENDKLMAIEDEEEYYIVVDAYRAYIEQREID